MIHEEAESRMPSHTTLVNTRKQAASICSSNYLIVAHYSFEAFANAL